MKLKVFWIPARVRQADLVGMTNYDVAGLSSCPAFISFILVENLKTFCHDKNSDLKNQ